MAQLSQKMKEEVKTHTTPPALGVADNENKDSNPSIYIGDQEELVSDTFGKTFTTNSVRNAFVRKVYAIVFAELSIITALIAVFHFAVERDDILYHHRREWFYALIGCLAVFFVSSLVLTCGGHKFRRAHPWNLVYLTYLMVVLGVCLGIVCSYYSIISVLLAAGLTMMVVLSLTFYAFSTKADFTKRWVFVYCVGMTVFFTAKACLLMYFILPTSDYHSYYMWRTGFAGLGAVLMSVVLVIDTQWIMQGKHKYSCSPEDYTIAAFVILTDIISIFLYILRIFGIRAN